MSVVPALCWRVTGMVFSVLPGGVLRLIPGRVFSLLRWPVSKHVHTYEDQQDQGDDDDDEHPSVGECVRRHPREDRDTGQHYLAPAG